MIQDAKLGYVNSPQSGAPKQALAPQQQKAPQMAPAYQQAPPKQQAPLSENDKMWVDAIRANPQVANQIENVDERKRIQSLV